MKKTIAILLLVALAGTSCKKFVDTKPMDFVSAVNYYKTEKDLNQALAGIYDRMGDLRLYGRGMLYFLVPSDEFFYKRGNIRYQW